VTITYPEKLMFQHCASGKNKMATDRIEL